MSIRTGDPPDTDRTLRFAPGQRIDLNAIPTESDLGFGNDDAARESLRRDTERLVKHQAMLMAHEKHALLILFQGMDASGKDEAITHVLSAADPRGCEFKQFQALTAKEAKHDYLWRVVAALPARGQIGIFDRSYYESVVTERIHPEKLDAQNLPAEAKKGIWAKRFRHLNDFERYLSDNGIRPLKFFLHVSKDVQRRRLLERMDDPAERWQFSPDDVAEREHWRRYMTCYGEALTETNSEVAPWHVLPADREWCARAAVASVIADELAGLHATFPRPTEEERQAIEEARRRLESPAG